MWFRQNNMVLFSVKPQSAAVLKAGGVDSLEVMKEHLLPPA